MSRYLRYVIKNIEPFRIADESTSQRGEMSTLTYIPGSTIRGIIINNIVTTDRFEEIKSKLFSDACKFLNAYMTIRKDADRKVLVPSPKGFYEDKRIIDGPKEICNILMEDIEGLKRASLGQYAYMENGIVNYYSVEVGSEMKNTVNVDPLTAKASGMANTSPLFRNEYVKAGYEFEGYIYVGTEELEKTIEEALPEEIIIGNARSAGLGKFRVADREWIDIVPYDKYMPQSAQDGSCYLMLLSDTVMRNQIGEYCGLDLPTLERKLGVEKLDIDRASTTTKSIRGFNRVWGTKVPSVTMYEKGSVFKLTFEGSIAPRTMKTVMDEGLGVRKNEGYGRVLFLGDYEIVHAKRKRKKETDAVMQVAPEQEDAQVILQIAKNKYRNDLEKALQEQLIAGNISAQGTSGSQLGSLESLAVSGKYDPKKGIANIEQYLRHGKGKDEKTRIQAKKNSIVNLCFIAGDKKLSVMDVLHADIHEVLNCEKTDAVMGIPTEELLTEAEMDKLRLEYISKSIRAYRKGGASDGEE